MISYYLLIRKHDILFTPKNDASLSWLAEQKPALPLDHKVYALPYEPITEAFKTIHSLNTGILISFYKILCMKNLPKEKSFHTAVYTGISR